MGACEPPPDAGGAGAMVRGIQPLALAPGTGSQDPIGALPPTRTPGMNTGAAQPIGADGDDLALALAGLPLQLVFLRSAYIGNRARMHI